MARIFNIFVILALVACSSGYTVIPLEATRVSRPVQRSLSTASNTAAMIITNVDAYTYSGQIQIGTPPQNFSVVFDTGFPSMIFYSNCPTCNKSIITQFDINASSTAENQNFNLSYEYYNINNNFEAEVYEDYITIGGEYTVLGEFLVQNNPTELNGQYSGIVGLGFQDSSVPLLTLSQLLQVSNTNIQPVFSIHLTNGTNQAGSSLVLGGYNNVTAPQGFTNYPVSQRNTWQLNATEFGYAGKSYSQAATDLEVILASGFPYIMGGLGLFNTLLTANPKLSQPLPCSSIPIGSFYVTIQGDQYEIPAASLYTNKSGICSPNVQTNTEQSSTSTPIYNIGANQILLGVPFFQNYYVLFDTENQIIGLTTPQSPKPPTPIPPNGSMTLAVSIFTLFASLLYLLL